MLIVPDYFKGNCSFVENLSFRSENNGFSDNISGHLSKENIGHYWGFLIGHFCGHRDLTFIALLRTSFF
jgi:hypothetical protein